MLSSAASASESDTLSCTASVATCVLELELFEDAAVVLAPELEDELEPEEELELEDALELEELELEEELDPLELELFEELLELDEELLLLEELL